MEQRDLFYKRFWDNVSIAGGFSGCWPWKGYVNTYGYGAIKVQNPTTGEFSKQHAAHRLSFEINIGAIPKGMHVLHSCDNPLCVNPKHLRIGTAKDNSDDKIARGRQHSIYGVNNPGSRLNQWQVSTVRDNPDVPTVEFADEFGVSLSCIVRARNRTTYKQLDGS